jgi:amidase
LKDAHATAGLRTTTGLPRLTDYVLARWHGGRTAEGGGRHLMGKTNVAAALADPGQTANPIFGRTNNPWNVERTPGGSSGGAAADVAAGLTPFEVGTDLGGSIRIPAHFCGVYGLKPTEHRVSLGGVFPGLPSPRSVRIMSCVGPFARDVDDLALIYSLIAGPDGRDLDGPAVPVEPPNQVGLAELRIALASNLGDLPVASEVRTAVQELGRQIAELGAVVEEVALPQIDLHGDLRKAGALIGMMLSAFQPEGERGPATLAGYLAALDQRDRSIAAWEQFFDKWDSLLCPPAMMTAFQHCETGATLALPDRNVEYWAINAHTTLFNYSGHPALVLPCKLDHEGLPIGVQLIGKLWSEGKLLGVAQAVSKVTGGLRRPPGY